MLTCRWSRISAGMMVSMTKSALKALDVSSPQLLLAQLNGVMRAVNLTRMQMAINVAYFSGDEFCLSSAAMPPVMHYRAASRNVEEVLVPGLPLAAMRDAAYGLARRDFLVGDALVLLSDGLPELLDRRPGVVGYDAVRKLVARHAAGSAQALVDALVGLIGKGDRPLADDVTIVVVKRR
jgi:serine phosphatase RsbU (regulator of sigma subunit)